VDSKTLFFILGIGLVVLALVLAAIGLRFEKFPGSRMVQLGVVALFAAVVVGTAAFAWLEAEDEQDHREAELAEAAKSNEAAGNEGEAQEEVGPGAATTTTTASVDGAQVFEENGCGGCHTLAAAGSTGQIGPDLDGALKSKTEDFIRTSIIDPNAEIAKSYPPDVMPQSFGTDLSSDELDALVQYLAESTGAKGGGGSGADSGGD
jgi:mono/diheme cytochrome c family protein